MSIHKSFDQAFVVKTTADSSKRSLTLATNQLGVANLSKPATSQGSEIVTDFSNVSKKDQLQFFIGTPNIPTTRTSGDRSYNTVPFSLGDIKDLQVDVPSTDWETDEFIIGYDGFDDSTALTFEPDTNEELTFCIYGKAISLVGYNDARVDRKVYFTAPRGEKAQNDTEAANGKWTDQQVVEETAERLSNKELMHGVKFKDFFDVKVVNSNNSNPAFDDITLYNLQIEDDGSYLDLAAVQSQYNVDVKRTEYKDGVSTYTVMATASPDDFVFVKNSILKGCASCPTGFTENEGLVYSVELESTDANSTIESAITTAADGAQAAAIAGLEAKVQSRQGSTVFVALKLSETHNSGDGLLASELTAVEGAFDNITVTGPQDISGLCEPDSQTTLAWTAGESGAVTTDTYTIVLPDTNCGETLLPELQAIYGQNVTEVSSNQCSRKYSLDVTSSAVFEECAPEFLAQFESDAPSPYGHTHWNKDSKVYEASAKMGIHIKAKKNILDPSEAARDNTDFIATSPRLIVAGGHITTFTENLNAGEVYQAGNGRFNVKVLNIATEPENLGGNFRYLEDMAKIDQTGRPRHEDNNYAKELLGEETALPGRQNQIFYTIKVERNRFSQSFTQKENFTYRYHFIVAPGAHKKLEDLLNSMVYNNPDVEPVQAFLE